MKLCIVSWMGFGCPDESSSVAAPLQPRQRGQSLVTSFYPIQLLPPFYAVSFQTEWSLEVDAWALILLFLLLCICLHASKPLKIAKLNGLGKIWLWCLFLHIGLGISELVHSEKRSVTVWFLHLQKVQFFSSVDHPHLLLPSPHYFVGTCFVE